jgi:type VI secretion system protein ImpF
MTVVVPGLLDRLMGATQATPGGRPGPGLEQFKDCVARDLEDLLNTRAGCPPHVFDDYPEARASVINYGLLDFAAFSLSSSEDRAAICASLKDAIERHEPRLRNVSATLERADGSVNRLSFVIHATLQLGGNAEPVNFNAVLQPSSLHYAISSLTIRTRRWTST